MKIKNLIALCILITAACYADESHSKLNSENSMQDTSHLRVLCYNIHHANPPSRPDSIDVAAIASVINREHPDLVALQEVDVFTQRSGKSLHEAETIARLTGMKSYFAKAINFEGGEYGIAILSRLPMEAMQNHPLPTAAGTGGEPRTLATAVITLPTGQKIVFACTHLDAQSNDTNRIMQAQKIVEILKKENRPLILAGDFNAVPTSRTINIFDSYFTRSCLTDCGFTIPVINPTKTIDFIVFAPKARFRTTQHQVISETYASDHLPILSVLQLQ